MPFAPLSVVNDQAAWEEERSALLGRRISELGLSIRGSRVERLIERLYAELAARNIAFRPTVYLSDQWGCPDGTPLIGVPFYLVDARLERIEAEMSAGIEDDAEAMRYLRHECGHALNYAFKLYERPEWRALFGPFSRPYRERYRADPFSRNLRTPHSGVVRAKASRRGLRRDLRRVADAGAELAARVRRLAGAAQARVC